MRHARQVVAVAGALGLLFSACGDGGGHSAHGDDDAESSTRTIEVAMKSFAYEPASFTVEKGSTVTFRFSNDDTIVHEALIGTDDAQSEHEREMSGTKTTMAGHGMGGSDAVTIEPGDTGELTSTFSDAGTFLIGCHEPGHYQSGMKATITVKA